MARPTIENIRSMGDFLSLYRWDVTLIPPTGVSGIPDSEKLNFRCETSELPKMTGTSTEITVRGHKVKQPGIYNYDNVINLAFVETVDATIHKFAKAWREALWSSGTGIAAGKKSTLQGTLKLTQLDNQDNGVWEYTIIGVFLETYDFGSLDGAQSDVQKPTMAFGYDYFTDKPLP
jgi:hypothetical protein